MGSSPISSTSRVALGAADGYRSDEPASSPGTAGTRTHPKQYLQAEASSSSSAAPLPWYTVLRARAAGCPAAVVPSPPPPLDAEECLLSSGLGVVIFASLVGFGDRSFRFRCTIHWPWPCVLSLRVGPSLDRAEARPPPPAFEQLRKRAWARATQHLNLPG